MGDQKDVVITYETLYELLRLEKTRAELQKLDKNFLNDCSQYIKEKRNFLEQSPGSESLFSSSEVKNTELQLTNVKKVLKELMERREKKVIQLAIDKSKSATAIIDTSPLLKEEHEFFERLTNLLAGFHSSVEDAVWNPKTEAKNNIKMVRFLDAVPKFVGPELEIYGPFKEDDIANLPSEIAAVLVMKGRAEEIKGS